MRTRLARHLGILSLIFFTHLGTQGCSSSSEGEEDVEATEEGNAAEGEENGANPDAQAENSNAAPEEGQENLAQNAGGTEGEQVANGETPTDSTNANLADVITDVNAGAAANAGVPPPAEGEAVANAAPAETQAPAAPPVAVGSGPAGGALPEFGSKMPYIVQPGDTLAKIAGRIYGDTGKWKLLASLSNLSRPNRIYPGDVIYYQLTQESQKFAQAYETVPRQEVQAVQGDTLAKISKRVLGSSVHWRSIWRQNDRIDDPDVINPGQTVYYIQPGQLSAMLTNLSVKTIAASKSFTNKVFGAEVVKASLRQTLKTHKLEKNWVGNKLETQKSSDVALDLVVSGISAILI